MRQCMVVCTGRDIHRDRSDIDMVSGVNRMLKCCPRSEIPKCRGVDDNADDVNAKSVERERGRERTPENARDVTFANDRAGGRMR